MNANEPTVLQTNKPHIRDEAGRFVPGVSGNPGGRPKNTLKAFLANKFRDMSDEEKEQWFEDNKDRINPLDMWKMAEGNPKQDTAVELTDGEPNAVKLD